MSKRHAHSQPFVSVIIPAFNYARYIADCLQSVIGQVYPKWECIVVDDGSTDNTSEIVADFARRDKRIRYAVQSNQGQPVARNTGIASANGDLFQFLDADDQLHPSKIKRQVDLYAHSDASTIVYGDVLYFDDLEPDIFFRSRWEAADTQWMPRFNGHGAEAIHHFIQFNPFELGSALFPALLVKRLDGFDASLKGVEDYDLGFRLALGEATFLHDASQEPGILMRHHSGSFSKNEMFMYLQELKMRKKLYLAIEKIGKSKLLSARNERQRQLARKLQDKIIDARRSHQPVEANMIREVLSLGNLQERTYLLTRLLKARFFPKTPI